jgi:hypothetical protein
LRTRRWRELDSNSGSRDDGITIRDCSVRHLGGRPGGRRPTNGREEQIEFGELHATPLATGINCGHKLSSG